MKPTPIDRTSERLTAGLHDLAGTSRPDYRDDILRQVARTRQRPRWSFLERWIPMTLIALPRGRTQARPVPRTWRIALVAGVLLALVAGLVAGAARLLDRGPLNALLLVPVVKDHAPVLPDGGPTISRPGGFDIDADGRLVIPDVNAGTVFVLSRDGALLESWGETGSGPGQLQFLRNASDPDSTYGGAAWLPDGTVAIADPGNARVQVFTADGTFVREHGGYGAGDGQFLEPIDVATGPDGSLYVVDDRRDDITQIGPDGTVVRIIGRHGAGPGEMAFTGSIAVDGAGAIYNADWDNRRIQSWAPDGSFRWSTGVPAATNPDANHANDVDVDADGFAYVATDDGRLLILAPDGTLVGTWRAPADAGDPSPMFVAVDGDGSVVVADLFRGSLQRLALTRAQMDAPATPTPSPAPSAGTEASPEPSPDAGSRRIQPVGDFPVRFTVTAPSDWTWQREDAGQVELAKNMPDGSTPVWFIASRPQAIFADPCHPDAEGLPVDGSVLETAQALAGATGMIPSELTEATISGHPAVVFDLTNRIDLRECADPTWVTQWRNVNASGGPGTNQGTLTGAHQHIAVVDVDGERVIFWTEQFSGSLDAVRDADTVFRSLTIP